MRTAQVEWDDAKAERNLRKHGVSFREGASVFDDEAAVIIDDDFHSETEQRFRIVGYSLQDRILLVAYTHRVSDIFRIISARRATARERRLYEEARP